MWYLLVAAGAGYFAQRWQSAHKERLLLSLKCQDEKASSPSSAPATPKSSSCLLSELEASTSFDGFIDDEGTSIDCRAPFPCFVSKSAEDHLSLLQVDTIDVPQFNLSLPQVLKPHKRSACEAFSVQAPDAVELSEGTRKDQIAASQVPDFNFLHSKQNTCPASESANIEGITKSQSVSTSKPSPGFAITQGNAKDKVVYPSKFHLDSVDIDDKEEQPQGDVSSPSSCCSSSSTVLNSPVGRNPTLQKQGAFQFQGKEQRQESIKCGQLNTLQKQVVGSSSPSLPCSGVSKRNGQGDASGVASSDGARENLSGFMHQTSSWECEELLATSTDRSYVFRGENQRGLSRTESLSKEFTRNDKVEMETIQKQSTFTKAGDITFSEKVTSLESTSCSIATENACEAESESLVSFGLAMAVCFMVSSSKKEMENMGKVLKEAEDLVSDMRKELEERRAPHCATSLTLYEDEGNEGLLTIKSKDAATQVGKVDLHTDSLCQVGSSDDESIRSVVTEEHAQCGLHISDLEAGHENKPHFVETNLKGNPVKQNEEGDSDCEKYSSTPEETGEDDYVLSLLELERKLWRVFQEKQEEKILGLEEALERALSELQEKEEELQWWKNRAAWLMEHPIGSTSGAPPVVKPQVERMDKGLNCTDALSFLIETCSNASEQTSKGSQACNTSTLQISASETNFSDLEDECIEIVGSIDGFKNRAGHEDRTILVGLDCSNSSSDDSVLSSDVRAFTYPGYIGSMEP